MRALCISGGGSLGAYVGGNLQYLVENGKDWDIYVGCSTGSLLITKTSLGEMDELKKAYTTCDQTTIFPKVNPFNKKGGISVFNAIKRFALGKRSLGEADGLYARLKEMFPVKDYYLTRKVGKQLVATTTNYTRGRTDFFHSLHADYDTYIKATYASASVPLAMDWVEINKDKHFDGGVCDHVPLQKAIDMGATEIDCFVMRKEREDDYWHGENMVDIIDRTKTLMLREISYDDVAIGLLKAKDQDVIVNMYYFKKDLADNSLMFDRATMLKWWEQGYADMSETAPRKFVIACAKSMINVIA